MSSRKAKKMGAAAAAAIASAAAQWTDDDELRLQALLAEEYDGEGMRDFMARVSPRLPPPRHVQPVIDALEEAREASRDPKNGIRIILIEMPPRHAKTTTVLHGLAWRIFRDPACTNAYITYGDDLSASKSRLVRNQAIAAGVRLAGDMANLAEWRTVEGGGLLAGGILGPLTGKGIDGVLVVDDPIKNREEAESEAHRNKVWDQFTDVCFTRLEGAATVVVMMTRWHPDDLIGRILERQAELEEDLGEITIIRINLPALAEPGDALGRAAGEALWPERYDVKRLNAIRRMLGEYSFGSMYQQHPRLKGAQLFSPTPARFFLVEDLQDDFGRRMRREWKPDDHRMIIACDPAASIKTKADFSAAFVLAAKGWGPDQHMWIVDGFRRQISIPMLVSNLRALVERWYGIGVAVEAVGAFKAVPDMLKEHDPALPVLPIEPLGDKYMRAQPVAAAWNQGRVHVPTDAPWAKDLIKECEIFTGNGDSHDDQVDAIAHGWNTLHDALANAIRRAAAPGVHLPFG